MDAILFSSALLKLFYVVVAIAVVWIAVRMLRSSTQRDVRKVLDLIDTDPKAAALYWGLTFFGICYVIGAAIG